MLTLEHSVILLTFIKLPFVIKVFVLSIFEWPFYTGLTVYNIHFTFGISLTGRICSKLQDIHLPQTKTDKHSQQNFISILVNIDLT